MKKLVGTVRRSDLEGGHWTLETEDGDRYQLAGSLSGVSLKDGARAQVEGKVERDMMGIGMTGPSFAVSKIELLD
jgi:hypothetical protein